VQPAEILEFYRDRAEIGGFELKIAAVLKDSKKLCGPAPVLRSTTRPEAQDSRRRP